MNDLSLLLYFADVLGGLSKFLLFVGVVLLSVAGVTVFVGCMEMSVNSRHGPENNDYIRGKEWRDFGLKYLWVAVVAVVVSLLMPSRETMYMIAASEVGEEAIQTPEFAKMRKILNKYLDEQLSDTEETEN